MKKFEIIFLLFAVSLIVFLHFCYFKEIYYDCDLSGYAYNSLSVLKGMGWYYTTWHPKPPGINFIILAAFKLFGNSFKSIYLAALFFNLVSLFFIYLFSKLILSKETKFYFLLPIFFTLIFVAEPFHTYAANTEVFLATFEIGGMLFLGLNQYFISGLLLGAGFLIRQSGAYTFLAGLIFIIALYFSKKTALKTFIHSLINFAVAFMLPLILISIYFMRLGVLDKFLDNSFVYNLKNMGEYLVNVRQKDLIFTAKFFLNKFDYGLIFFGILSLLGIFYAMVHRTKVSILIGTWFTVSCVGLLINAVYRHHFIQLIAPLACISVLGLSENSEDAGILLKNSYVRNRAILIFAATLFIYSFRLLIPTTDKSLLYVEGAKDRWLAAAYIKENTSAQDKIFIWDDLNLGSIVLWSERDNIIVFHEKYAFLPLELRDYWVPYVKDYKLNQKQLLLKISEKAPKYIIIVLDYGQAIRWRSLIKKDSFNLLSEWETAKVKALEMEKNAFSDFFRIVDKEYELEKEIGGNQIQIYRYKNEKK